MRIWLEHFALGIHGFFWKTLFRDASMNFYRNSSKTFLHKFLQKLLYTFLQQVLKTFFQEFLHIFFQKSFWGSSRFCIKFSINPFRNLFKSLSSIPLKALNEFHKEIFKEFLYNFFEKFLQVFPNMFFRIPKICFGTFGLDFLHNAYKNSSMISNRIPKGVH